MAFVACARVDFGRTDAQIDAKVEVHRLIGELARNGLAILMASSDLTEMLVMSDRVLVTHEGRMRRFVQSGPVTKFALWDPGKAGYAAGLLVSGLLDNSIKPTVGGSFKAGELGQLKFGPNRITP